jgi:hypothetical protein
MLEKFKFATITYRLMTHAELDLVGESFREELIRNFYEDSDVLAKAFMEYVHLQYQRIFSQVESFGFNEASVADHHGRLKLGIDFDTAVANVDKIFEDAIEDLGEHEESARYLVDRMFDAFFVK